MLGLVKTVGPLMQTITLVIKATQMNNVDRYALTTVLIYGNEVISICYKKNCESLQKRILG